MYKLSRGKLEVSQNENNKHQFAKTISIGSITSPPASHKVEFMQKVTKQERLLPNFQQEPMSRCRLDYLSPTSACNAQLKPEIGNFKQNTRHDKMDTIKLEALNKICEAYKEGIQYEIKELQKQLRSPNHNERALQSRKLGMSRPVSTSSRQGENRLYSKDGSLQTSMVDSGDKTMKEALFRRNNEDKENFDLKEAHIKQVEGKNQKTRSTSNLSGAGLYDQMQSSSGNSSIVIEPNRNQPKLSNLKGNNTERKSNTVDVSKKVVRFSHHHSESSDVTIDIKPHSDSFNHISHGEYIKILADLGKIFNTADFQQIVPFAQKTEKIIKLLIISNQLPKMEKMLAEVHGIIFPEADPNEWAGNLDKMTVTLRKWSQNNKSVNDLIRFRGKVASVVGFNDNRTKDEEIVAKVKSLNTINTDRRDHHSDPTAEKSAIFFEQFKRLFKAKDCENALSKLNQIYRHDAEMDNFKMVVSTYLNIDEDIKLEDFFKVLIEAIENMKSSQQRSHSKIVESIQQQLGSKEPNLIIAKLTKLLGENKAPVKMQYAVIVFQKQAKVMLKSIVKSAKEFLEKYAENGTELLLNCRENTSFQSLLSDLKLLNKEELEIRSNNHTEYFKEGKISYFNIFENDDMCIGVFCLSKGRLSLHDHPGMMVLSKVLCGKIQRRNMDLVDKAAPFKLAKKVYQDNDYSSIGTILEARLESDRVFDNGEILELAPNKGNIHSFLALEDTALLDILLPNYDNKERFCNFYYELGQEMDFLSTGDEEEVSMRAEVEEERSRDLKLKENMYTSGSEILQLVYALPPEDLDIIILEYKGELFT